MVQYIAGSGCGGQRTPGTIRRARRLRSGTRAPPRPAHPPKTGNQEIRAGARKARKAGGLGRPGDIGQEAAEGEGLGGGADIGIGCRHGGWGLTLDREKAGWV